MGRRLGLRSGVTKPHDDFCSIYVIGSQDKAPIKIGYALDPFKRLSGINTGHHIDMFVHYHVWVADMRLAQRVEAECHRLLDKAGKRIKREWFSIDVEWAKKVIAVAARNLNIPLFSNKDVSDFETLRDEVMMATMLNESGVFIPSIRQKLMDKPSLDPL